MDKQRKKNVIAFLRTLISAWLLLPATECGQSRVYSTTYSTSAQQTSIFTFATSDMAFAYYNSSAPGFEFLIKALYTLSDASQHLVQKYRNDLTVLNKDILNEMVHRIPGQRTEVPTVYLYPTEPNTSGHRTMLNCFVFELFPPVVQVTFLKNNQPLVAQVNSSLLTFPTSWMFQVLKYVSIQPVLGDIYTCVVELQNGEKIQAYWEPATSDSELDPVQIAICTIGFLIGAVGLMVGLWLIFYKQDNTVDSGDQRTVVVEERQ